ncbi:transglutaminase-like superfamily protein [Xylariales sp. AK1849]|nr:transglutaminase-like superfamily protein [Xylariales sp. AK1849]
MAEVEERQFNSLAERIAALNQQKNFSSAGDGPRKRPPPPPPPGRPKSEAQIPGVNGNGCGNGNGIAPGRSPTLPARPQNRDSAPVLPRRTTAAEPVLGSPSVVPGRRAPPLLPTRTNTTSSQPSPALPPRRPSTQTLGTRRGSNSSELSYISTVSSLSLQPISSHTSATSTEIQPVRKLPPSLDQAKLPSLPPTRREREAQIAREAEVAKVPIRSIKSAPIVPQLGKAAPSPSLPPRLPSRPTISPGLLQDDEAAPALPTRRLPPPPTNSYSRHQSSVGSNRPHAPEAPPPVPVSSRPSMAQIDAVVIRAANNSTTTCLVCRDFSHADAVAAQYPSHSLPRHDPVGYLANVLCSPFPSATDKARAIFTWCHHNIAYNVEEFFGNCMKGRNVEETIFHGKAVCQGYAEVYQAVAQRAGLQCELIGGHGKGYGYTPLRKGQPPPRRDPTGHAWNAVQIDNGEWKLLDACWGAGNVGNQQYNKQFKPEMFCLSNDLFGLKHFPRDERHFYRSDGRIPTWEEYIVGPTNGEKAQWYSTATDEGISEFTFSPAEKHIPVNSDTVIRFQFSKICEHWKGEKHGKGKNYLLVLSIHGVDGRKDDMVPLETDGFWWWIDINARELGAPGQKVFLYGIKTFGDQDARGMTKEEYFRKKGKVGYSLDGYAHWELV